MGYFQCYSLLIRFSGMITYSLGSGINFHRLMLTGVTGWSRPTCSRTMQWARRRGSVSTAATVVWFIPRKCLSTRRTRCMALCFARWRWRWRWYGRYAVRSGRLVSTDCTEVLPFYLTTSHFFLASFLLFSGR